MELAKITDEQRALIMAIAETVHPLDFVQAVGLAARHRQKAEDDAAQGGQAGRQVLRHSCRSLIWEDLATQCEGIMAASA